MNLGLDNKIIVVEGHHIYLATRMAGLLGKIEPFDQTVDEWPQYVERLEHFFKANGIVGDENKDKRRSTFLTVVGAAPYKLLQSLLAPKKVDDKTFEQLTEILANHYSPPPSEVVQRYRFNLRMRAPGESVATYVAELRRLAEFCNYGDSLKKMLRDRLVVGVNHERIQERLLAEKDLTFERALDIAQGSEEVGRNLREIRNQKIQPSSVTVKQEPVNKVQPSSEKPRSSRYPETQNSDTREKPCYRCGGTNHKARDCKFREQYCRKCELKGHIARVCRGKPKRHSTKTVDEETVEESDGSLHAVRTTTGRVPPLQGSGTCRWL